MISKVSFLVGAISLLLGLALATMEKELDSVAFSYSGPNGPSNWGKLKPAFSACSTGKNQSPVNIKKNETVVNKNLEPLSGDYATANATLINKGFYVELKFDGNVGGIMIDGTTYSFEQLHWHSPSEHLIDGERYQAEMHLVHKAEDNSTAVIAILFQYGNSTKDADPLLAKLAYGLEKLSNETHGKSNVSKVAVGMLNAKPVKRGTRKYYRYVGSLTTPPCTENVIWTVLSKARPISKEQIAALKAPLEAQCKDDARPVQQLNGRKIELYDKLN